MPRIYLDELNVAPEELTKTLQGLKGLDAGSRAAVLSSLTKKGPEITDLGRQALSTAEDLKEKFDSGNGTSAVGASRGPFGLWYGNILSKIPGTSATNFSRSFDTLKSQLSLDAAKYLKGSGQVSDAERKMLSEAVSKLSLDLSEDEFSKTLDDILTRLSPGQANGGGNGVTSSGIKYTIE